MASDTPIKDQLAANGLEIVSTTEVSALRAEKARLRAALLIAEHGLTASHGLMAYDDGTPVAAKQHFRLDNTEELRAIKKVVSR